MTVCQRREKPGGGRDGDEQRRENGQVKINERSVTYTWKDCRTDRPHVFASLLEPGLAPLFFSPGPPLIRFPTANEPAGALQPNIPVGATVVRTETRLYVLTADDGRETESNEFVCFERRWGF